MSPLRLPTIISVWILGALAASPALAQDDAFDFFREEAQVYTASRRPESARRAPWVPRIGWEFFLAGRDLLQPYRVESADGTASPRSFEGGMSMRFGL